jgi:hypothetical protein
MGYTLALIVLGFCSIFAKHLAFRVMNKASMIVGSSFAALLPLYTIPSLLYRPSNIAAVVGLCIALLALVIAIGTAVRTVWRNASTPETQ